MTSLDAALTGLAATPVLLVATDFDGTLAPIVDDPDEATVTPRCLRALAALARRYHTRVAVISGRGLADLEARLGPGESGMLLVGSHGSEFEPELAGRLTPEQLRLRATIREAVDAAAQDLEGVHSEHKDASSSLHYRRANRRDAARALHRLRYRLPSLSPPAPQVRRGKKVVELAAIVTDKGEALRRLRRDVGATAVMYIGDDRTDEDVFRSAEACDVTVKVGPGPTSAAFRVDGPNEVADLLARLADARLRALLSSVSQPITDLGFISDQRTGALVSPAGEIIWMCASRFDAPAAFASLLGGPSAGYFAVGPAGERQRGHQRYVAGSLVLETKWPSLIVTDYLDPAAARRGATILVRDVRPRQPGARCRIEFAPHLDFARMRTRLLPAAGAIKVVGGRETMTLQCPGVGFEIAPFGGTELASATVDLDGPLRLVLRCGRDEGPAASAEETTADWRSGTDGLLLPDRWRSEAMHSTLVLRGLVYAGTGAIVAALTTSLPEALGFARNWDYRYCWIRDAAMAADALIRVGSMAEAGALLGWLCSVVAGCSPEELRPLYGIEGEEHLVEAELGNLIGYGGSQPVRVGNAAAEQLQVDVFGAIVDLVHTYGLFGGAVTDAHWSLVAAAMRAVAARWREPDAGIWELRHDARHHVHSKTMSWVAADRSLRLAAMSGRSAPARWRDLASEIRDDVLAKGWSEAAGAFTVAYDAPEIDASALVVVTSGLVAGDDPRATSTVEAVQRELCTGATVYRYRYDDGLAGDEGGFHLCTSWLVNALCLIGRRDEAEALFTHLVGAAGATGLLSEQIDPATGAALGNVPQAYSHTGVIWNALLLGESQRAPWPPSEPL
ncbi:MAG: trehalose-phosphatase [Anaerolineae bacterium]